MRHSAFSTCFRFVLQFPFRPVLTVRQHGRSVSLALESRQTSFPQPCPVCVGIMHRHSKPRWGLDALTHTGVGVGKRAGVSHDIVWRVRHIEAKATPKAKGGAAQG